LSINSKEFTKRKRMQEIIEQFAREAGFVL